MAEPLRVYPLTLTHRGRASEHVYAGELGERLRCRGVRLVDDPGTADVVHLFEVNAFTRESLRAFRYPAVLRLLYGPTPVVVSTDDLYFTGRPALTERPTLYPLNHRVQRWLFERVDAVVAISESVRENIGAHVSTQIDVVHHGVDERYRVGPGGPDPDPFVLHVSLASRRKNPEAIREVARRTDEPFVVAGSGWAEYIPETPAYDNVELRGYVPEAELVDLYERAAVFYFPTRHEGFGLPILEAMAAGCAVVTTDVYAVPEVVGDAGILCDPDDVDDHLHGIQSLLEEGDRRRRVAGAARERAKQFTWERAAAETEAVYRSVVPE